MHPPLRLKGWVYTIKNSAFSLPEDMGKPLSLSYQRDPGSQPPEDPA
jgi:hypothetical protein